MTVQDKNRKELDVGDEVVVQFRVVIVSDASEGDAEKGTAGAEAVVQLETVHNKNGSPLGFITNPSRVILQRKAKASTTPFASLKLGDSEGGVVIDHTK